MAFKIKHALAKAVFGAGFALLMISVLYGHFIPDSKTVVIAVPGAEPDTSSLDFLRSIDWLLSACLLLAGYAAATLFAIFWQKNRILLAVPVMLAGISIGTFAAFIFSALAGGGIIGANFRALALGAISAAVLLWAPVLDIAAGVLRILDGKNKNG